MSGVHVEDVAGMIVWALENERLHGPVNAVMPEPFRNADFTRAGAKRHAAGNPSGTSICPSARFR